LDVVADLVRMGKGDQALVTGRFRDPGSLAQAPSSNQQRVKIFRARYRDCLSGEEIAPFECKAVYQDCKRSII
jgi:hypothetical protein